MGQDYEVVIGLEVHVELSTASKIFCGCSTRFGAPPNTQVCPVCLGLPGSLPVLNQAVLQRALLAALALTATPAHRTKFDRKNYFYPDLPKAYQISQYDLPLASGGAVTIETSEGLKRIGVTRVHMEEDAGKLVHVSQGGQIGQASGSLVDYNRAGIPLIEIVSEPDLRSPEEAYAYLTALKEILRYTEVSDCNMEEGSLRCDANISVRPRGQQALGTKAEIKNMNSFKNVRAALQYEALRHIHLLDEGGRVVQETRLWDADKNISHPMRSKEEAHDYRYFPEPDLPEIVWSQADIENLRQTLPELPRARRQRMMDHYGLSAYDAGVLTASRAFADYYEEVVRAGALPKSASNWLTGELLGWLNNEGKTIVEAPVSAAATGGLVRMVDQGKISGKIGKQVFSEMLRTGEDPETVVRRLGVSQISDDAALEPIIAAVLSAHPGPVAEYRSGKTQTMGFLVGQVMKQSRGQANPQRVNQLLAKRLQTP